MTDLSWTCPAGEVIGRRDGAVLRAGGIPYATAERFTAPTDLLTLESPFAALSPSPGCPQLPVPELAAVLGAEAVEAVVDEHCQRLSLTLPADIEVGERLPVVVWIHGGSYAAGAGDLPIFDPCRLAAEQRVLVVAVTYRLGLLGYLGTADGRPANLGLLDQISALRWVQRNIAAFGGDPDAVTVMGQSAGADAAIHLMIAKGAAGLFRRVIAMSAPFGVLPGRAAMTAAMAQEAADLPADGPVEAILAAQPRVVARSAGHKMASGMPFGVQYGRHPLPAEADLDAAWAAAAPRVDLLLGWTTREAALFTPRIPRLASASQARGVGSAVHEGAVRLGTDLVYAKGGRRFARRHAEAGGRVYRYTIDWGPDGNRYRAAHTADLPLLLGDEVSWAGAPLVEGATWPEIDEAGREVRRLWADFARTGELAATRVPGVIDLRPVRARVRPAAGSRGAAPG